jgi:hypothetical protein
LRVGKKDVDARPPSPLKLRRAKNSLGRRSLGEGGKAGHDGLFRHAVRLGRNKKPSNGFVIGFTDASRTIAHKRAKALKLVPTLIEACASMSMIGEEAQALLRSTFERILLRQSMVRVGYL